MGTFEFGRTIPTTRAADATEIARKIAQVCRESEGGLYNGMIRISEHAVHNGSGDLMHINWEARVTDISYDTADYVQRLITAGYSIDVGVTEELPDDFDSMGMFTVRGTERLKAALDELESGLRSGAVPAQHLDVRLEKARETLAKQGHGEVYDTAVREEIWQVLDRVLAELGIQLLEV